MSLNMTYLWMIVIVLLLLIEFATSALTTIWFAGGALIAVLCSAFGGPVWLQIILFIAGSAILLLLTRPVVVKILHKGSVATNADSLIGHDAVVTEKIDNLRGTGAVRINGQEWTARNIDSDETIEKDEVVMVLLIEGVKLIVGRQTDGTKKQEHCPHAGC